MSGAGWRGLVVGLFAITVAVSAFYWVLTFSPRQITTTVTVAAPPPDGGGSEGYWTSASLGRGGATRR